MYDIIKRKLWGWFFMKELQDRILKDGHVVGNEILKVDKFPSDTIPSMLSNFKSSG